MRYSTSRAHGVAHHRRLPADGPTGCVADTEPAFWAGWDRSCGDSVEDYFRQLTEFEPRRAAQYGIQHYTCWREPEGIGYRDLSRDVLKRIPKFWIARRCSASARSAQPRPRNEIDTYTERSSWRAHRQWILIHTPLSKTSSKAPASLVDVLRRTVRSTRARAGVTRGNTRSTCSRHGFWAVLTLTQTKISPQRAVDVIEKYGPSASGRRRCDWGPSDPIAVPRFAMEDAAPPSSGIAHRQVVFDQPRTFSEPVAEIKVTTEHPDGAGR